MAASILTRTRRLNVFLLIGLAIRAEPFTIDVPEGTPLSIRLASALSSQHSKPGEQVRATLIAPVVVEGEELIPAGFQVQGAVQNPTPDHKKLNHAVLWIGFGDLVGKGNRSVSFRARVLSVDNGREPVDSEGMIHGLRPLPRRPTQIEDLLLLAAYAHPAILASAELGRFIVSEEEKPRITYTPGVELWLSLTAPLRGVTLPPPEIVRSAAPLVASPALNAFVSGLPLRTETPAGTPSDLINVVFLGSKERLLDTFELAGW